MKRAAARCKATGISADHEHTQTGWLSLDPIPSLSRHLGQHLHRVGSKALPRSALLNLALQITLVGLGVRRAALVDTFSPSLNNCLSIAQAIHEFETDVNYQESLASTVTLLRHAPTEQTFLISRRKDMWLDRPTSNSMTSAERLYVDVRSFRGSVPRLIGPSPHLAVLIDILHKEILDREESVPHVYLIQTKSTEVSTQRQYDVDTQQTLVGTALAGWLLEYSAVYCLEDEIDVENLIWQDLYTIQPITPGQTHATAEVWPDLDTNKMTNCLGSHSLILIRVMLCSAIGEHELLAFSIPHSLSTSATHIAQLRDKVQATFQHRLQGTSVTSQFGHELARSLIEVSVSTICLDRVAL